MYKKLDCVCKHSAQAHQLLNRTHCLECACEMYDPAGHNPELENILCPRCRLIRLEKVERHYICIACSYVMLESQVLEMVG
jgi:hypothetical protein